MNEREARLAIQCVVDAGHPRIALLVAAEGVEAVWEGLRTAKTAWGDKARSIDPAAVLGAGIATGARYVIPGDEEWPWGADALASIENAGMGGSPLGLWALGSISLTQLYGAVSIVGSRASTRYGEDAAYDLAAGLARLGRPIISGGAYGIDAAAHRGALSATGITAAVLANGVDNPYPAGNARLFAVLRERGVLVSELPPGTHPTRSRFLVRNRLVAALALGTVVVEAAARSGARNTVAWAHHLGREVLAVPGPVSSAMSATPHRLIRDHEATLVTSAAEIHALVTPLGHVTLLDHEGERRRFDDLDPVARAILEQVPGRGSITTSQICQETGLVYPQVVLAAQSLVDSGFLVEVDSGFALGERRGDIVTRSRRQMRVEGRGK